jgi:galactarate dehydratase
MLIRDGDTAYMTFHKIIDCASGKDKPFAEKYGMHNYLCVFNPAPIT